MCSRTFLHNKHIPVPRYSFSLFFTSSVFPRLTLRLEKGMLTPTSWSVALQSAIVSYAEIETCASSKAKNKRNCDVGTLGANIISQTGTGGLFNDLIQLPTGAQMPALIPAMAAGLSQIVNAGQAISQLAASTSLLQAVAEICLWIAYEKLNGVLSLTQPLVIPASDISTPQAATAVIPECPDITAAPNCEDCGGNNGDELCIGTYNAYTSCPCYDPPDLKYAPFDASDISNMAASWAAMTVRTMTTSSSAVPSQRTPVCCLASMSTRAPLIL